MEFRIDFSGKNDAVLCDCGNELRLLTTEELGCDLYVVDMFGYVPAFTETEVKQEMDGVVLKKEIFARPQSFRDRVIHAGAPCLKCMKMAFFEIGFDGNKIVKLENLRG